MSLTYVQCLLDVRESLAAQYFAQAIKDTQHSTRLMDAKDLIYVADITDPYIPGLDFLQKFNFTIDLEKNEIWTGREEIPLFSASIQHSKLCSVLAKEKRTIIPEKKRTIIPARSECLIQGVPEVSGQFRYAVTDIPSQVSQKGVLVMATFVDLEREAILI
ncbi:hypothetical protein AVEN_116958-1 [Araneus ventricosus]|uniref:Uncharacterized protein n=1 Tax=Araneus ventricosus TaxID=182803 RepID=A0A4Y2N5I4_ARAVE|nr:hypothetical protein AVEN_116958-1 [Araneus ventricosus]